MSLCGELSLGFTTIALLNRVPLALSRVEICLSTPLPSPVLSRLVYGDVLGFRLFLYLCFNWNSRKIRGGAARWIPFKTGSHVDILFKERATYALSPLPGPLTTWHQLPFNPLESLGTSKPEGTLNHHLTSVSSQHLTLLTTGPSGCQPVSSARSVSALCLRSSYSLLHKILTASLWAVTIVSIQWVRKPRLSLMGPELTIGRAGRGAS